tara:strand:+ start:2264 stop:3199 length:936 start_codon:yes stop_codon:yes gene_type:complete
MKQHLNRKIICKPKIKNIDLTKYHDKILNQEEYFDTGTHPKLLQIAPKVLQNAPNAPNAPNASNPFICDYCFKNYKYNRNLTKHLKTCKIKKEKEHENNLLQEQINDQKKMIETQGETIEKLQKEIYEKSGKTSITNNTNNNTTNNTNNTQININLNRTNYKDTNYDEIDHEDIMYAIGRSMKCLETMVQLIHFNNKYPQYQNMYMPDLKSNFVMMYDQDKWMAYPFSKASDRLIDNSRVTMSDWVIVHGEDYPNLQKKFDNFMERQRDEEVIKAQIRDVKMLMFNKRDMPKSEKTVELLQKMSNSDKNNV